MLTQHLSCVERCPTYINFWQPATEKAKDWRKFKNLNEDDFIILNVGRLHDKKGLDLLPEVLAPLRDG